jgi:hypothetical protein
MLEASHNKCEVVDNFLRDHQHAVEDFQILLVIMLAKLPVFKLIPKVYSRQ